MDLVPAKREELFEHFLLVLQQRVFLLSPRGGVRTMSPASAFVQFHMLDAIEKSGSPLAQLGQASDETFCCLSRSLGERVIYRGFMRATYLFDNVFTVSEEVGPLA
jgi:hypothetical protein